MSAVVRRHWYDGGFPALRVAEKKMLEARRRAQGTSDRSPSTRRSRSVQRGRSRSKSIYFEDSDDDIPYYRSKSVLDEKRRSSITHKPVVNEEDVIYQTYTGDDLRPDSRFSVLSRAKSRGRRPSGIVQKKVESTVPHKRDSYEIDKLQAAIFKNIQKTYGESALDANDGVLYDKLAKMKLEHYRLRYLKLKEKDKSSLEDKFQQFDRLKNMARKYKQETLPSRRKSAHNSIEEKFRRLSQSDFGNVPKQNPKPKQPRLRDNISQKHKVAELPNPIKDKYLPLLDRYQKRKKEKQAAAEPDEIKHLIKVAEQMLSIYGPGKKDTKKVKTKETKTTPQKTTDTDQTAKSSPDAANSPGESKSVTTDDPQKLNKGNFSTKINPGVDFRQRKKSKTPRKQSNILQRRTSKLSADSSPSDTAESKRRIKSETDASSIRSKNVSEVPTESSVFTNDSGISVDIKKKKKLNRVKSNNTLKDNNKTNDMDTFSSSSRTPHITFKSTDPIRSIIRKPSLRHLEKSTSRTHVIGTETEEETEGSKHDPGSGKGSAKTVVSRETDDARKHTTNAHPSYLDRLAQRQALKYSNTKSQRRSSSNASSHVPTTSITGYDYAMTMDEYEQKTDRKSRSDGNVSTRRRRSSVSKKTRKRSVSRSRKHSLPNETLSSDMTNMNQITKDVKINTSDKTVVSEKVETGDIKLNTKTEIGEHEVETEYSIKPSAESNITADLSLLTTTISSKITGDKEEVHEEVIEKADSPILMGAGRWRNLVQKYLRQPSPKIGQTEHRKIIETVDSDDDDEFDIFERAKQRYNLNVDSDDDDDDAVGDELSDNSNNNDDDDNDNGDI